MTIVIYPPSPVNAENMDTCVVEGWNDSSEIGHLLGRKGLEELVDVVRPDTILRRYRKLIVFRTFGVKRTTLYDPIKIS